LCRRPRLRQQLDQRQGLDCSAANQSSTADLQEALPARDNADPVVPASLPVDRGPSIPRAPVPVDSSQAAQQVPVDGPVLVNVRDSAHVRGLADRGQDPVAQLRLLKLDDRNALRREGVAVVSSNTRRPKKAR
jgi:hypothetical protein